MHLAVHASNLQSLKFLLYPDAPEVAASNFCYREILQGERLHLQCDYDGVPSPSLQWLHNGIPLMDFGSVMIVHEADVSILVVNTVTQSGGGTYTCFATNELGSDSYNYTVHVPMQGKNVGIKVFKVTL